VGTVLIPVYECRLQQRFNITALYSGGPEYRRPASVGLPMKTGIAPSGGHNRVLPYPSPYVD